MKNYRLFLVAALGILLTGCYNDFDTPAPAKVWSDEDLVSEGLELITIKELKQKYATEFSALGGISNTGSNGSWADTKTLKLGAPSSFIEAGYESDPGNMKFWEEAAVLYIKCKVISRDAEGNVYNSL
ncbi:MAG: hypothetical protein K2J53_03475 [Alistipes sp.]|nr:hypothetical protein [Alistipes sp.]